jgi:tRNA pseudouridine38-40 synthase
MPTLRLDLAYDGTGFRGYARQNGLRTIQGTLEDAVATALGFPVETSVAGRTDAGVHARGQVVSFLLDDDVDLNRLARSVDGLVGPEISIRSITEAEDGFNARFSALWREYRYEMSTDDVADPLTRGFKWHVGSRLDLEAMAATAAEFVGSHDFSAFCRSVTGKSNKRHVEEARWEVGDTELLFWIRANAFCHQMVRSLVGLAYDVGRGFIPAASVAEIVESGERGRVASVAPPHGLSLWEVGY